KTGGYRWFLGRALPVRDAAGAVVRWFGTCTDIDDQKRAEEALREADRRKDEFLAMLGHELRNPLGSIRNAVEILHRLGPQEPGQTQAQEIIERQVTHLTRIIDDLLDVSRIARGKILLRKERCNLTQLVSDAMADYRSIVEGAELQLSVRLPR